MLRSFAIVGVIGLLAACSGRALPDTFPESSPASPKAAEAAPLEVAVSLSGDPPLPGEPQSGWTGLKERATQDSKAETGPDEHHHPGSSSPDTTSDPQPAPAKEHDHAH